MQQRFHFRCRRIGVARAHVAQQAVARSEDHLAIADRHAAGEISDDVHQHGDVEDQDRIARCAGEHVVKLDIGLDSLAVAAFAH